MLVDELTERDESIEIVKLDDPLFLWDRGPVLYVAPGLIKTVEAKALDELLNLLKIPTKYMRRCIDYSPLLAQRNINFWLKNSNISVLIENNIITQVFDGKRSYLPSYILNDHIVEHLGTDTQIIHSKTNGDFFTATYIVKNLGIKILFSDCFSINPRIDGAYYKDDALWVVPVRDRKFRAADQDLSSLLAQVDEFCDLAMKNIDNLLLSIANFEDQTVPSNWIDVLGSELRLNRKIINELKRIPIMGDSLIELIHGLLARLFIEQVDIDMETTRNIQVAITNYVINGRFK